MAKAAGLNPMRGVESLLPHPLREGAGAKGLQLEAYRPQGLKVLYVTWRHVHRLCFSPYRSPLRRGTFLFLKRAVMSLGFQDL